MQSYMKMKSVFAGGWSSRLLVHGRGQGCEAICDHKTGIYPKGDHALQRDLQAPASQIPGPATP